MYIFSVCICLVVQRKKLNNAMNRQRGGPLKKTPISSRLSMPPANTNPNLTTIKTVDIGQMNKQGQDSKPQQNQGNNQSQNQQGNQFNRGNQQQQKQQQPHQNQQDQKQKERELKEQDNKQPGMPTKDSSKSTDKNAPEVLCSTLHILYEILNYLSILCIV